MARWWMRRPQVMGSMLSCATYLEMRTAPKMRWQSSARHTAQNESCGVLFMRAVPKHRAAIKREWGGLHEQ